MKRALILLFLLSSIVSTLVAQQVHQLRGTVIDKSSRKPLEYVNVIIIGLSKGAITDAEGKFTIENVPLGWITKFTDDKMKASLPSRMFLPVFILCRLRP
ncbi:TonB-dependent receptor [Porphyromonas gingivalis]|nr:TonB-dependent receptor [Porphyromonas gingivalis]